MKPGGDASSVRTVSGVQMLWHNDWYDGPLEGVATFEGSEYYFRVESEDWVDQSPRRYVLIKLVADELDQEHLEHAAFERLVGTRYCEHVPPDQRVQRTPANWPEFYRLYPNDGLGRRYKGRGGFAVFTLA